jgi:hypothetical protein
VRRFALLLVLCASPFLHAAIFTVNDAGDGGDATPGNGVCATATPGVCTLRAALQEANALAGTDTINFGIGSGAQTIQPASLLPVSSSVIIDATTQLGTGAGPFILIDGQNTVVAGFDLTGTGHTVTIQGFAIGRFTTAGIQMNASGNTLTVKKCHIGVGLDGLTDLGNGDGILVRVANTSGGTLIAGDAAGGGNVISGNNDMGIDIVDTSAGIGAKLAVLTLQGNRIGVGSDGMTAVPNASGGVRVDGQFGTVTVGGSVAARNIISGNGGGGYLTQNFFQADSLTFSHNYVGLAQDGITARGNNGIGVDLVSKQYAIHSNVIGSNGSHGIFCNTGTMVSSIRGNRIGVAVDGSVRGNGGTGIRLTTVTGMVIGGAGADENIIANNTLAGIAITSSGEVEIAENAIHANGALGIDLNDDGVTANDALDADSGVNGLQNAPSIASAVRAGGVAFISGSLSAAASTTYRIRFYASTAADPSGFGEGQTFLGSVTTTTTAGGNASFTFQWPVSEGMYVTATATDAVGRTSEFSNARVVSASPQIRMAAASVTTPESGSVSLTVERIGGSTGAASVDWTTIPGSASTSDFTAASGTVNFANGETSKTINITITPDTLDEPAESFGVELANVSTGTELGAPSAATIHITDDDPAPSISIADNSAAEANAPLAFTVTLSAQSGRTITVDYVTSNATAAAGSDYAAAAGTLVFAPGETAKSVSVQLVDDANVELTETFTVTLSNPADATLLDGTATGTINDNDGMPSITIDDVAVVEGDLALFTVRLSAPSASSITVGWSTSDGSATAGVDYGSGSGTLTFSPGELEELIVVATNEESLAETSETFFVDLAGPVNATLADAQGGGTIADDDGTPSLTINDPAVVEGAVATFTVTLAPPSASTVTVDYTTVAMSATSGDFTPNNSFLSFGPGETSKTISIATAGDDIAEQFETFGILLSSPSGATLADSTATATIIDDDGMSRVTIGNVTQAEGNAGTTVALVPVDLSHASALPVDVVYSITDGTASSLQGDYTGGSSTLTFAPGETSKTISVPIHGDALIEPNETIVVNIGANAIVVDGEGIVTIANDDGGAQVSVSDAPVLEGNSGTSTAPFQVTLNAASELPVSVQWTTMNGTAVAPSDYAAAAGTLTFAPGETYKWISIDVAADTTFEGNETFTLQLLGATNAAIADAEGVAGIVDDDAPPAVPAISIANASLAEGNAGSTNMTFTVSLDVPTINTVTVAYATTDQTALSGFDFAAASGTVTFAPGVTSLSVSVPIIGDTALEGTEIFHVVLASPVNATIASGTAAGTIIDDDVAAPVPSISIAAASQAEGDAGSAAMLFAVQLSVATTTTVSVQYATGGGTASAGTDYASMSGTLTFAPGVTMLPVTVPVIGDTADEANETFVITLSAPSNATLGAASAIGTIVDDDVAPAVPAISIANASLVEGNTGSTNMTFAVSLDGPTTSTVSVAFATANGTAIAGTDYAATSGMLTFAPGVTSLAVNVPVIGDTAVEANETFSVTLSSPSNATVAVASATGTITDDDSLPFVPAVSIANVTRNEGDSGATVFAFAVTLDAPASVPVSVSYATSAGSASSPADFIASNGTIAFAPGMTSQTVFVAVHGDTARESDETFVVTLSGPSNATLAVANATGTIRNDDDRAAPIPALRAASISIGENAGEALLTLTLSSRGSAASVRWMTRSETARGGTDFVEGSGVVSFDGTTATLPLAILDDAAHETVETFVVEFFDAKNVTLDDLRATITIQDDDASRAIVLVAGSLNGDANSRFGTAVQMVNATDVPAAGTLVLHGAGEHDHVFDIRVPYALEARELRSWNDFLEENGVRGLGTIDILPATGAIPQMTVRIYDDGGEGTTGFTLPVVMPEEALVAGDRGVLIAPADPIAFRFNVGVRTLELGATMTITVRDRRGEVLHTLTREYPPAYFVQQPAAIFAERAGDFIEVEITSGSAFLYGAAVDNTTNDPSVQVLTK